MESIDIIDYNFYIVGEDYLNLLVENIYSNKLLTLFSLTFFSTLYCCVIKSMKKHKYMLLPQTEIIEGTIVNNDEKV